MLLKRVLSQRREEQGLVDPTFVDRDAPLYALDDHIAAIETRLVCELAGRQVIGHRSSSSFLAFAYMFESIPRMPDVHKAPGDFLANFCAKLVHIGAWRSLVARTVRVGEVPSSNLGAPI
jgi:hypothetical protein